MSTIIILVSLLFLVGIIAGNAIASYRWHEEHRGEQHQAEAEHYYWYILYYNPDDPRIFKPRGGGYTINFGRPLAILVTFILVTGYLLAFYYR